MARYQPKTQLTHEYVAEVVSSPGNSLGWDFRCKRCKRIGDRKSHDRWLTEQIRKSEKK